MYDVFPFVEAIFSFKYFKETERVPSLPFSDIKSGIN